MVKDKIQNFQAKRNFDDYENVNLNAVRELYDKSVKDISKTKDYLQNQMDLLYFSYVRRDPFRAYYDY